MKSLNKITGAMFIALVNVAATTRAGPAPAGGRVTPLTMEKAVLMALKTHPAVKASDAGVSAARKKRKQVTAAWLPQAGLEASYFFRGPLNKLTISEQIDTPVGPVDVGFTQKLGSYHNVNAGVQAGWRAWDWGVRSILGKAADAGVRSAKMQRKDAMAKLAYGVRTGFLSLLFFRELERIAETGVKRAEQHLRDARVRIQGGVGDRLKVAQAATAVAARRADLVKVRQQIKRIRINLNLVCGIPAGTTWRARGNLKALAAMSVPRADAAALKRIPSVQRLNAGARALDLKARATLRSRWPTLDIVAGAAILYPKNFFEKEWGPAYQAGVVLRWHFWDGGLKSRQAEEDRAKARQLRQLGAAVRTEARRKMAEAYANLRTAGAELKSAEKLLKAAHVYLNAAQVAVQGGLGRSLEVTDAQAAVLAAQASIQKAYFQKAVARAQMLFVLGVSRRRTK